MNLIQPVYEMNPFINTFRIVKKVKQLNNLNYGIHMC